MKLLVITAILAMSSPLPAQTPVANNSAEC
jgi:hypothetical protein